MDRVAEIQAVTPVLPLTEAQTVMNHRGLLQIRLHTVRHRHHLLRLPLLTVVDHPPLLQEAAEVQAVAVAEQQVEDVDNPVLSEKN